MVVAAAGQDFCCPKFLSLSQSACGRGFDFLIKLQLRMSSRGKINSAHKVYVIVKCNPESNWLCNEKRSKARLAIGNVEQEWNKTWEWPNVQTSIFMRN